MGVGTTLLHPRSDNTGIWMEAPVLHQPASIYLMAGVLVGGSCTLILGILTK